VADLLLDTDVLVDHLRGAQQLRPRAGVIAYSVITRCELFAGHHADEPVIGQLLAPLIELVVDRQVAERAGRLRREVELRTPDALIAATAMHHGLGLVTRNRRHFDRVPGLHVRVPG
jgi:predicted nucleic acid-binding protein